MEVKKNEPYDILFTFMADFGFQQTQRTVQVQSQKMSQRQIYSLNLLSMNSQDLRNEIFAAVDKNPALEIVKDPFSGVSSVKEKTSLSSDYVHFGKVSASGQEKSDSFQEVLESRPDERESLQEHLLSQLNVSKVTEDQYELSKKLIENLNSSGFHTLAPHSLLDKNNPKHTTELLNFCLDLVQNFDPIGTCCTDIQESLFIQAKDRLDVTDASLFLLDGHFDFLSPPRENSILKRIHDFVQERKKLVFADSVSSSKKTDYHPENFTLDDVKKALAFIKTLEPQPARQFNSVSSAYVVPDVYVTKIPLDTDLRDSSDDVVSGNGHCTFKIRVADNMIPSVAVSSEYIRAAESSQLSGKAEDKKFINSSVKAANVFIEDLEFRNKTIVRACAAIVRFQLDFFEKGPQFLSPLRQKDIAEEIKVHEATVSRMANSKFIQCEWGLFPIKYFFSNAVGAANSAKKSEAENEHGGSVTGAVSKESVKYEIEKIVNSQPAGTKKLSDQKIVEQLGKIGIKIARRTVAKYRSQLNIESSYSR